MSKNEIIEFSIDNIPVYLNDNKDKLIKMNLSLDRHEISKSLTISLNRSLMGTKTKLADVYDLMMNNFDDVSDKVNIIEKKINEFNSEQKYEYFVDPENILYLVFFKQILYIQNLISDIYIYIGSNINLVFIYSYLISKLYNEPEKISSNYVFIIEKIMNGSNFSSNYDNRLKEFFNNKTIGKIFLMIKIIYVSDTDFDKLLIDINNEKMEEYKKNNNTDMSDSWKEIEKESKNTIGGAINIYELEQKFEKKRNYLMIKKRDIIIANLYNPDNVNILLVDSISIELWYGYNLFIYKRFNFDFKDYQTKINEIINSNGLDNIYLLNLDYLNDIDAPDAGMLLPSIIGGSNSNNKSYYAKYIKYKNKYLNLKNNHTL